MNNVIGFSTQPNPVSTSVRSIESRSTGLQDPSINTFIDKLDVLQLFSSVGKKRAFSLYAIGWFAFLLINAAIIVILIPVNDPVTQQNNQVLHASNLWKFNENRALMQDHQLNLIVRSPALAEKNSKISPKLSSMHHEMQSKTENQQFDAANLILGFDEEDDINGIPISSTAFFYEIPKIQLPKQFCLDFSIRNKQSQIQANQKIVNIPACSLDSANENEEELLLSEENKVNGIAVETSKYMKLEFQDMLKQQICFNTEECKKFCLQYGGKVGQGVCKAEFSPAEICLVFRAEKNEKKEVQYWSYERGCFADENMFKFDFSDRVEDVKVVGRNAEDPVLKALEFSKDYSPIQIRSTNEQKISRILFTVGAITLLSLSAFVMVMKFNSFNKKECHHHHCEDNHIDISFDRSNI